MMFFMKPSTITIDAFTYHSGIHQYFPIKEARHFFPDWWKSLPKEAVARAKNGMHVPIGTARTCAGILAHYTHGMIVPMWSDLQIQTTREGGFLHEYSAGTMMPQITPHGEPAITRLFVALKIATPWMMKEKSGVNFYLNSPYYNSLEKINRVSTTPGILNFKDQNTVNLSVLLDKVDNTVSFAAGEPVIHLVPLSDKRVKVKCHLVDRTEYDNIYLTHYRSSFINTYHKQKRCPFH
jgi:hypothetical protein